MLRRVFPCLIVATLAALPAYADDKDDLHKLPPTARAILEKAETFELLSLDPDDTKEKPKDGFHGWIVLGRTTVKDGGTRKKLVTAFEKSVDAYKDGPAKCFNPRHGIRVTHDGKTAEFVICFECAQTHVWVTDETQKTFLVSKSPVDVFNQVLKDAGVPLPKGP